MYLDQLSPTPSSKVQFKLSFYRDVPKKSGGYVLTSFNNYILYIGLSDNLYNRFQQHIDNAAKTNVTNNGKAVWFNYYEYDINNLPKLERTWLNQYIAIHGELPILNKINSPIN